MNSSVLKASAIGVGILLSAHVFWGFAPKSESYPAVWAWLLWLFPLIAAFAVAYLAPHNKILLGISMGLYGALLSGVSNFGYQAFGVPVDFPGFKGALTLFVIALISNAVLCTLGSTAGYFLSRRFRDAIRG